MHVPAIESLAPWLKKDVKNRSPALTQWIAWCREQLEALTARPPAKFTDFRRPAAITCKCGDCAELKRFLEDPRESVHRFAIGRIVAVTSSSRSATTSWTWIYVTDPNEVASCPCMYEE